MRRKSVPHPDYLFKTPTHWRIRAEKMRTLAEEADDSTVRAMMLRIAADYDRLAERADDRAGHDSIMFQTAEVKLKVSLRPRRNRTENSGPRCRGGPARISRAGAGPRTRRWNFQVRSGFLPWRPDRHEGRGFSRQPVVFEENNDS